MAEIVSAGLVGLSNRPGARPEKLRVFDKAEGRAHDKIYVPLIDAVPTEVVMLTRLEVKGFKNLVDFSLDFGPYTCIAGPNGVGKSNIFDAIQFLSLLTTHPISEAALNIRNSGESTGDIADLVLQG